MLKNIQEIYLSVDKNQTTDVVQLLLDNNCLTIAAYIGPSGFAQSMKTLTNDWESLLDDYNNSNTTTDDGETTTFVNGENLIKLEVLKDRETLMPLMKETVVAA